MDDHPAAQRTLERMAALCHQAMTDRFIVRYANEIIAAARPRDYAAQISAIRLFTRSYFRFVDNPAGVQRIRTPLDMLTDIEQEGFVQGACDDAAVLVATLGTANALGARFRAVAFGHRTAPDDTAPLTHVITDLWDGQAWEALDITKPDDVQREPYVVRTLTMEL